MPCISAAAWYAGRMEKAARIFHSFAEAEKAEREYYRSLTPEQRLEILFDLVAAQHPHATEQRLERVCRIIKLQED
jgi:uncharacterized protein YdeI (YjbR/CyaY-like superfamily)